MLLWLQYVPKKMSFLILPLFFSIELKLLANAGQYIKRILAGDRFDGFMREDIYDSDKDNKSIRKYI